MFGRIQSMIFSPFLGFSDNSPHLILGYTTMVLGPSIEGLSRSGENYSEAIKCLQSRYDRPRLIHKAHVRMILEAPSLKEGSGRELQRLHDTVQQHLRALKTMDCEPPGPFVTSILELKLDSNTMFEWQSILKNLLLSLIIMSC